jgi:serine/threonine protein kinase
MGILPVCFAVLVLGEGERPIARSASFGDRDHVHVSKREMEDRVDTKEMLLQYLPSLEEAEIRQVGKIQRWQRGNLVGSGSYGQVYLAMNTDTAELFVVKQVPFTAIDKREEVLQLEQEIALLAQLEHANIVRYLGTELSAVTSELSIFLEYMPGGSIADLVRSTFLMDWARKC